jgi:hypothetical protein
MNEKSVVNTAIAYISSGLPHLHKDPFHCSHSRPFNITYLDYSEHQLTSSSWWSQRSNLTNNSTHTHPTFIFAIFRHLTSSKHTEIHSVLLKLIFALAYLASEFLQERIPDRLIKHRQPLSAVVTTVENTTSFIGRCHYYIEQTTRHSSELG